MIHISKPLDKVMIDITVKQMLNPDNKDFYIGNLTLENVKDLFVEMDDPSTDVVTIFWKAFHIANAEFKKQQLKLKAISTFNACPECGCSAQLGYVSGVRCPNCDYIEE